MTALVLFLFVSLHVSCGGEAKDDGALSVFCGSASKPPMEEIARLYEARSGVKVEIIFGGSGSLLSQMELSRKGDIYIPGSPDYVIIGERKKLLVKGSEKIAAYLVPAVITPAGNPGGIKSLDDLTRPGIKVGIGNPETVCLGLYSIELLQEAGTLDETLGNVVTFGGSCSKTANLAVMGHVDAIMGWRVFRDWNRDRMELVPIPPKDIPRISYIPISTPVFARDPKRSSAFTDFVLSPDGKAIIKKYGYLTDESDARRLAPRATIGGEYKLPDDYFKKITAIGKN